MISGAFFRRRLAHGMQLAIREMIEKSIAKIRFSVAAETLRSACRGRMGMPIGRTRRVSSPIAPLIPATGFTLRRRAYGHSYNTSISTLGYAARNCRITPRQLGHASRFV